MKPKSEDIAAITQHVLNTMVQLHAEPTERSLPQSEETIKGTIRIQGAWDGEVEVSTNEELARRIGEGMLCIPSSELNKEDILDVLAEITNMIGGNIKSQMDSPSTLTLPSVSEGASTNSTPTEVLCSIHMVCESNPINVKITEQN